MLSNEVAMELEKLEPLFDALSLFGPIAKNVELRIKPELFNIIASQKSQRFVATLQISCLSFSEYLVDDTVKFPGLQVLIDSFYDDLIECAQVSTTMSMYLMEKSHKIALRFREPSATDLPPMIRLLDYLPVKGENLGDGDCGKYFKILSSELRRIIKQLPLFQHHSVCVTVTNSQVKFSVGSKEIVVTKENGIDHIKGFKKVATLQVVFLPMLFFIDLTYKSTWIWFHKKPNSGCLICVPIDGFEIQYVIHFPKNDM